MEWMGVQEGSLPLRKVLENWLELNSHCVRTWDGDVPWRYNEQATLSYFIGAIWRSGGFALAEYWTHKNKGAGTDYTFGRGDLWFEFGEDEYEVEAKFQRCPLNDPFEPESLIHATIEDAVRDVARSKQYHGQRIMCGLAAFPLTVDINDARALEMLFDQDELRSRLMRWVHALRDAGDTCAWFIREDMEWCRPVDGMHPDFLFPGVAVMLRRLT
jgi:hypothetical protein